MVLKCSWENVILPGAFKNNGLCKIWGANRVYYGEFENREYMSHVSCLMPDVWCLLSHVRHLMSDLWFFMSDVSCLTSDIWCLYMSTVCCLISDVWWHMTDVKRLMSDIRLISNVWCQTSHVASNVCFTMSDVWCLLSDVWCQMSNIRRLISLHVSCL